MSDRNHYAKLGVDETASFEQIQDAKNRLLQQHSGDRKQIEAIEAAYDAILMDRLRLRQEGKIKVPDRIRFPERTVDPPNDFSAPPANQSSGWVQRLIDSPSRADVLWPGALFLGLGALTIALSQPALTLAFGTGFSLYFLNRKENKFGRALLLTLLGLIAGILIGTQLAELFNPLTNSNPDQSFAALVTFFILWVIDSFLR